MIQRPTFSILHPSARPDAWRAVYDAWLKAAERPEDVEYVLVIDPRWGFPNDPGAFHAHAFGLYDAQAKVIVNSARMCYVDAVNIAAENATGKILIVVADDQFPAEGWDDLILSRLPVSGLMGSANVEYVARVPTGTPQERERNITVMPIVSRARYERLGYLLYPGYESMFSDNDLTEHAQHDGCFIDLPELPVFPHRHPFFDKTVATDAAYARQNRREAYEIGAHVLAERRATGFGSKLEVVPDQPRAVVPSPTVPNTGKNLAICLPGEWFHCQWVASNALQLCCHLFARFRNVLPSMPVMSSVHSARHTCFAYIKALAAEFKIAFDYVLWIDDDNLLTPEQFEMMFNDLETHPEFAGVVGWCWIYPDTRISCGTFDETGACRSFDYEKIMAADGDLIPLNFEMEDGKPVMQGPGGWSGFPVVLHRASVIDEIGKFPFRAFLNDNWSTGMTGEDIAFFMNATEHGLKFALDRRVKVPHMKYGIPEPEFVKTSDRKTMLYGDMKPAKEGPGLLGRVRKVIGL